MTKSSTTMTVWTSHNSFNPYYHLSSKHDFTKNNCDIDVDHAQVIQAL